MTERIGILIGTIIGHALRISLPSIISAVISIRDALARNTSEQAAPQPDLKKHLIDKIKK